ncbi:hypothetical protein C3Y87_09905 [Carbonactinospora thermoautotrophica]|uniref:Uncharacterized protein n=1 Tax=Carbonactinospora thermoautotrophica TaxID=1469144 RepID=A0A132N6S2_9ACTN|nr:hypothetical protein TH66_05120 [Carbonactinospora thermoautotrophica]KWX05819.1 hypothetical protein TR74_23465 [Carbonactinospora thermoautotrophica]MCX9191723.1 hypothetical protein [Carbonactinospora thermoautotrophica]
MQEHSRTTFDKGVTRPDHVITRCTGDSTGCGSSGTAAFGNDLPTLPDFLAEICARHAARCLAASGSPTTLVNGAIHTA